MSGELLGHYRLNAVWREGAVGRWYRARDERLRRDVQVLVFHAGAVAEGGGRDRMLAKARALARIEHPNVARVYAFDTLDGIDFMVSEWVEGESSTERFDGGGNLCDDELVEFGTMVANALSAAHQAGVVHGCLDSDHVRVTPNDDTKVIGFGLPELPVEREAGQSVKGLSLSYRSPEQLRGEAATIQSDIYALGVLLYESATGVQPFGGESVEALLASISGSPPRSVRKLNGNISAETERVILKCLEVQPHRRFALAKDAAAALQRAAGRDERGSLPEVPRTRTGSVLVIAFLVVVLGWGGLVWYRTGLRAPPPPPEQNTGTILGSERF